MSPSLEHLYSTYQARLNGQHESNGELNAEEGLSFWRVWAQLRADALKYAVSDFKSLIKVLTAAAELSSGNRVYRGAFLGLNAMINNLNWRNALRLQNLQAFAGCIKPLQIHAENPFDFNLEEFSSSPEDGYLNRLINWYFFMLLHADSVITAYDGIAFYKGPSDLCALEPKLLKKAGIGIIVIPYGGDAYNYARIGNPLLLYGLHRSYPEAGRRTADISRRIVAWDASADLVFPGAMVEDGLTARIDTMRASLLCIDQELWSPSDTRARPLPVKFIHYPNHKGFKGTEIIVNQFDILKRELPRGSVELDIISGVTNDEIREVLPQYHVLIEQLLFVGYAQSAIEGMACGLAVMANLGNDLHKFHVYRVFGTMSECPIINCNPSNFLTEVKKIVIERGEAESIGAKGRAYVKKFHSYESIGSFLRDALSVIKGRLQRNDLLDENLPFKHTSFTK